MKTLRLILGDQLNSEHSWFKETDENVVYCLMEMRQETDYVVHHIQKAIGFFAAMRDFSGHLKSNGHHCVYFKINDKQNKVRLYFSCSSRPLKKRWAAERLNRSWFIMLCKRY